MLENLLKQEALGLEEHVNSLRLMALVCSQAKDTKRSEEYYHKAIDLLEEIADKATQDQ